MSEDVRNWEINEDDLRNIISENLTKLISAMEWSRAKFAAVTGISEATLSNYIKKLRLPSLTYLLNLCSIKEFRMKGIDLTIDRLLAASFNPSLTVGSWKTFYTRNTTTNMHKDFLGNYYCYLFDQSKTVGQDEKMFRELRYGVISVFEELDNVTGQTKTQVIALFFKQEEKKKSIELKKNLDIIFSEDLTAAERNSRIKEECDKMHGTYFGGLSVSENHAFINLQSEIYSDNALIVLYSPQKKKNRNYIGGLGCVASVAHGRNHAPTAQKIILSRYELKCSKEEIATYLSMSTAQVKQTSESKALAEMCKKLYGSTPYGEILIDEADKIAILENRLIQLVRNYIEKSVCCVSSVSEDDDKNVVNLIKNFKEISDTN